jgi:Fe-S-cluster-containing dehydrogenase component/anaerobic selenocysteine-containing dehydrogenase
MADHNEMTRRDFFKTSGLMGAAAVLPTGGSAAGMLIKHLVSEDNLIPGVFYWFNSTCNECSAGCGVQAHVINGNVTKLEGNKEDPINQGGLCARGQSAPEGLYSPSRVEAPMHKSGGQFEKISWSAAMEKAGAQKKPGKIVIVSRNITGALKNMIDDFESKNSDLQHFVYEPFDYASISTANKICFNIEAIPVYSFDQAETIVSFGTDFLETWISPVSYAYGYSRTRMPDEERMSRFIQFESYFSMTGANADDRFSIPPGSEMLIALAISSEMSGDLTDNKSEWQRVLKPFTLERAVKASGVSQKSLQKMVSLLRSKKPSLVIAGGTTGRGQHATVLQMAVNLINVASGNYGKTITFDRVEHAPVGTYRQMSDLIESMEQGKVAVLIINDTVPEFALPNVGRYQEALKKVPLKIKLASVKDDTFSAYDMILPILDWMEVSDLVEPRSGIISLRQPLITPFTGGRNPGQVLADLIHSLSGESKEPSFEYDKFVKDEWEKVQKKSSLSSESFQDFWDQVLKQGGVWLEPGKREVRLQSEAAQKLEQAVSDISVTDKMALLPTMTVRYGDGRQTGRLWLNELPDPITTIVWDNPLLISPVTAKQWKCTSGDMLNLSVGGKNLAVPVHVQPGTHDLVAAMPLGAASKQYAPFHAYAGGNPLQVLNDTVDDLSGSLAWVGTPVTFTEVAGSIELARAQGSFEQYNRGIAQALPLHEAGKVQAISAELPPRSEYELYPKSEYPVHHWGMVIDLTSCIGCGACAVACQAENNVFVVGKEQCLIGRQLSWLRIQRFAKDEHTIFQPMLCQQCDHAPCEYVCPVYAAVHNDEGLNLQVYNRCVGTRYCANNCPYKVRRFNWFTYSYEQPLQRQFNPRIFIRTRGIMEKCTFCIQRIREQKELAKINKRPLRDGEILPACAQSCPTRTIVFGDLNDPASEVAKKFKNTRGYKVLEDLNTRPSVVYLKRVYRSEKLGSAESAGAANE